MRRIKPEVTNESVDQADQLTVTIDLTSEGKAERVVIDLEEEV